VRLTLRTAGRLPPRTNCSSAAYAARAIGVRDVHAPAGAGAKRSPGRQRSRAPRGLGRLRASQAERADIPTLPRKTIVRLGPSTIPSVANGSSARAEGSGFACANAHAASLATVPLDPRKQKPPELLGVRPGASNDIAVHCHAPYAASAEAVIGGCGFASPSDRLTGASSDAAGLRPSDTALRCVRRSGNLRERRCGCRLLVVATSESSLGVKPAAPRSGRTSRGSARLGDARAEDAVRTAAGRRSLVRRQRYRR
jgi:hypothetical protein